MRVFLFAFLGILLSIEIQAQEKPYFQQRANYAINVTLNDTLHELLGDEKITYFNQSPDTLFKIYIHLWPNGYRDKNTAMANQLLGFGSTDFYYAKKSERGSIDQLSFKINGQKTNYQHYQKQADIAEIILNEPLFPGDSIVIETPFHVEIPGDFSRLGHVEQSYQITQWYPKVAVYDRQGWQMFPYLNIGEFYGDFGSFNVKISLPDDYYVAATGLLVNCKEEEDRIATRVFDSKHNGNNIDEELSKPSKKIKTLQFYQDSIHDFAWFADKRFMIAKREILLPKSGRLVTAYAYYLPENEDIWSKVPDYISKTLVFYSEKLGEYPYAQCTAVDGALSAGGGMEYPMITVISYNSNALATERVVMHEVGHNWFYGLLAFNERKYPWLDEGMNSFYENEYMARHYPDLKFMSDFGIPSVFNSGSYPNFYSTYFSYMFAHSQFDYQPIGLPSDEYSMVNYGVSVYYTPVMMFRYLKSYLGADEFDKIMFQFATEWRFKHPLPSDVQQFFEQKSGKNLDWFFEKLVNSSKPINMHLCNVKKIKGQKDAYLIKTKDVSRLGTPFSLTILDKGGNILMEKWITPTQRKSKDTLFLPAPAFKVVVNNQLDIPEVNKLDNEMRIHGLFRKQKLPKLSFLWRVSDPQKSSILYAPVAGWNYYNRWMLGMAIYSDPIVSPKLDFLLMPMFSFTTHSLVGSADIGYSWSLPMLKMKKIRIGLFAKQYNNRFLGDPNKFSKVEPSIQIEFKTRANRDIAHELKVRNIYINQTTETPSYIYYWNNVSMFGENKEYSILNLQYNYKNRRKVDPWSVNVDAQLFKETVKVSLDLKTQYTYAKNKGVDLRLFCGKISNPSNQFIPNMNFSASGLTSGYNGYNDYLFDNTMMGRLEHEGILSHQMFGNDGGFITPTYLGQTNDWIVALNLKMRLPGKIPLSVFGNIATFSEANDVLADKELFIYEAGVTLNIYRNIAEISLPLYVSKDIQRVMDLNNKKYYERIRFILNLDALNPFKAVKNYKQLM